MRPSLELLKDRKRLVGAEIGVADGGNAKNILTDLNIKKLYLVDVWGRYYEEGNLINSNKSEANARRTLYDFKQVVFIKQSSVKASKKIKDKSLDFVYIDANHQYEYVKRDILAWLPKIKDGGMIAGHDFDRKGVAQAVKELLYPGIEITVYESGPNDWYKYV